MGQGYSMLGLVVIVVLYAVIGLLAPALCPDRRILPASAVGHTARASGAWSLLRLRTGLRAD